MRAALCAVSLLLGCGPAAPTYHGEVEPLLKARCGGCHAAGGIAPFALETYDDAVLHAAAIASATATRQMPPWGVDGSGSCQHYAETQWLTEAELDVLARWADGDHPRGTARQALDSPAPVPFEPSVRLDLGADYRPDAARTDDYRCFVVDPQLTEDRFVTAYRVEPQDARIVHHVILFAPETAAAADSAVALDAADPGPGYACFGGIGVVSRPVVAWAPGTGATRFPAETGIRIAAGRRLVMQVHYNTQQGTGPDRTAIALELSPSVPNEATILGLGDPGLELAPAQAEITTTAELSLPIPLRVMVRGVYPHMHRLGRRLKVELQRSNKWQCAVDVPQWDFDWQRFYFYETPVAAVPGDLMRLSCSFDTSSRTSPVRWGEGTDDEMCLVGLYVTPR